METRRNIIKIDGTLTVDKNIVRMYQPIVKLKRVDRYSNLKMDISDSSIQHKMTRIGSANSRSSSSIQLTYPTYFTETAQLTYRDDVTTSSGPLKSRKNAKIAKQIPSSVESLFMPGKQQKKKGQMDLTEIFPPEKHRELKISSSIAMPEKDLDTSQGQTVQSLVLVRSKNKQRKMEPEKKSAVGSSAMRTIKISRNKNILKKSSAGIFAMEKQLELNSCVNIAENNIELTIPYTVFGKGRKNSRRSIPQTKLASVESFTLTKLQKGENITGKDCRSPPTGTDMPSPKIILPKLVDHFGTAVARAVGQPIMGEQPRLNRQISTDFPEDSHLKTHPMRRDETCEPKNIDIGGLDQIKYLWVYRHTGLSGLFTYKRGRTKPPAETIRSMFKRVYEPVVMLSRVESYPVTNGATPLRKLLRLAQAEVNARRRHRKSVSGKVEVKSPCLYGLSAKIPKRLLQPTWINGKRKHPKAGSPRDEPGRKKTSFSFKGEAAILDLPSAHEKDVDVLIQETISQKLENVQNDDYLNRPVETEYKEKREVEWLGGGIACEEVDEPEKPPLRVAQPEVYLQSDEKSLAGMFCPTVEESKLEECLHCDVMGQVDTPPASPSTPVDSDIEYLLKQDVGVSLLEYKPNPIVDEDTENATIKVDINKKRFESMEHKQSITGSSTDTQTIQEPNNLNDKLPNIVNKVTDTHTIIQAIPGPIIVKEKILNVVNQANYSKETLILSQSSIVQAKAVKVARHEHRRRKILKGNDADNGLTTFSQVVPNNNTRIETVRKGFNRKRKMNRPKARIANKGALKGKPIERLMKSSESKLRYKTKLLDIKSISNLTHVNPISEEPHSNYIQLPEKRRKRIKKSTHGFNNVVRNNASLHETLNVRVPQSTGSNNRNISTIDEAFNTCSPVPCEEPLTEDKNQKDFIEQGASFKGLLLTGVAETEHDILTEKTIEKIAHISHIQREFKHKLNALRKQPRPVDKSKQLHPKLPVVPTQQPVVLSHKPIVSPKPPGDTPQLGKRPQLPVVPPKQPGVSPQQSVVLSQQFGLSPVPLGMPPQQRGFTQKRPAMPPQQPEMTPQQPGVPPEQGIFIPMSPFGTPLVQPNGEPVVMRHLRPSSVGPQSAQELPAFTQCSPVSVADTTSLGQNSYHPAMNTGGPRQSVHTGLPKTTVGLASRGLSLASDLVQPRESMEQVAAVPRLTTTTMTVNTSNVGPLLSLPVDKRPYLYSSTHVMSRATTSGSDSNAPRSMAPESNFQLPRPVSGSTSHLPAPRAHSQKSSLRVLMDKPLPAHSRPANFSMYSQLECSVQGQATASVLNLNNKIGHSGHATPLIISGERSAYLKSSSGSSLITEPPGQSNSGKTEYVHTNSALKGKPIHKARKFVYRQKPIPDNPDAILGHITATSVVQQHFDVSGMTQSLSCQTCGKMSTFICSGCHTVPYCSVECQTVAWDSHSMVCK